MRVLKSLRFLFVGPMIVAMLAVINYMTSPGDWWVQWPALGIGIAWVISFFRVATAIVVMGGLAAFVAYLTRRRRNTVRA